MLFNKNTSLPPNTLNTSHTPSPLKRNNNNNNNTTNNDTIDAGKIRRLELLSVLRLLLAILMTLLLANRFNTVSGRFTNSEPQMIAAVYAIAALVGWRVLVSKTIFWRGVLFAQLMVDVIVIGLLVASLGGSDGGYSILYIMPIVAAATLLTRPLALFIGAVSMITLMLDGLRRSLILQQQVDWFVLGLYGIACFVCIAVLRLAAERAERHETAARQAQTSTLLMQELQEQHLPEDALAWLVFDQSGVVHLLNSMARSLAWQAGVLLEVGYHITPDSPLTAWLTASQTPDEHSIDWPPPDTLRLHTANTPTHLSQAPFSQALYLKPSQLPQLPHMTALTLELASTRSARKQQVQLAAMGQISASIAHEIRNPLGAISQAAELIKEGGELNRTDASLMEMVLLNTQRIERIVRNLLTWSRGMQAHPSSFSPNTHVAALIQQLVIDMGIAPQRVVFQGLDFSAPQMRQYADYVARFDTDHLYQVISNLLSNALRYAKPNPASIMVALRPRGKHVAVCVMDNGEPVDANVVAHLFEPFQSTSKQGTGLGLYLCREYAVANQGALQLFDSRKLAQLVLWGTNMDLHQLTSVLAHSQANTSDSTAIPTIPAIPTVDNQAANTRDETLKHDPWDAMPYTKAFVLSLPWRAESA
jgi:two-component system sensor histidine kinase PilS (NtrC family)